MSGEINQDAAPSSSSYRVGVARVDITPPVGIRLCGYAVREGFSHGIDAPLTATVLTVSGTGGTVALIAVDLTMGPISWAQHLRQTCAEALNVDPSHILINFNHTHSAPVVARFVPQDGDEQLALQAHYESQVEKLLVGACMEAVGAAVPARVAAGWGDCRANINRRQKTPEGDVLLGEDPNGFSDHSVGVLRFDRLDGTPLAAAFRFSCHPVTLGPRTNVISPDYPDASRRMVESALGCPSLFLQGCGGNQNPITGIGQDTDGREDTERIGMMLGAEVVKVCAGLRTHRRRCEPVLIRSVAPYWIYGYEVIGSAGEGPVSASEEWMELPLTPFGPVAEVEAERSEWARRLADARAGNARESEMNVAVRFDYWASLRLAAANGPTVTVRFPVQTMRIGDIGIVGLPFETMAETGAAVLSASPFRDTFVQGYSNGIVTYLPTPEISREGGMEARLGYKNYLLPSAIPEDWEPQIRAKAAAMLMNERSKS